MYTKCEQCYLSDFEICCKMLKKDIIIRVRDLYLGLNTVGRGNLEHSFI